jgi:predicted ATP-grasp superfamily ATP-dependent carboligase
MMVSQHLLIVGASARSAAFSALRAGLQPWCADLFADLDLQRRCAVTRLTEHYPDDFQQFIESDRPSSWMYTGGLENWPQLVELFARRRRLWGNGEKALSLARNPEYLTELLQRSGMPVPQLVPIRESLAREGRWLIKPRKSAGGAGIRFGTKTNGGLDTSTTYCQEFIEGESIVLLFLGDGRQSRLLGLTRQLVGMPWLHAAPFRYCGSIGPVDPGIVQRPSLEELGHLLASQCGLEGLFGVDGVLRDGTFWPVEINPRYTASVEVLEYAAGWPTLAWHGHIFTQGQLPPVPPPAAPGERCIGKAILFAQKDLHFPAAGPWMAELRSPTPVQELPAFADIPAAGQPIPAGRPILTLFAAAASAAACEETLRQKAADLDRWLFDCGGS